MKTRNTNKLLQYSTLSTAFLLAGKVEAQTEYHEFDPYLPLTNASEVFIDVNDDGVDDFSFEFAKSWGTSSTGYAGDDFIFNAKQFGENEMMIASLPAVEFYSSIFTVYCSFPSTLGVKQLAENTIIDVFKEFGKADVMARVDQCGFYGADGEQGEWLLEGGTKDYFVGFRTNDISGYYGWMRIRHYDFGDVDYVKDFYLNDAIGSGVQTPDLDNMVAPAPDNLNLFYGGDGKLMLEFNAASDEDSLQEYRVILRNTIFTSELTATICETTLPGNYITVNKTGASTYVADLSTLTTDWVGNTLEEGDGVSAYVYNKFNYPVTMLNGLSPESNERTLSDDVAIHNNVNNETQVWLHDNVLHIIATNNNIEQIVIYDILGRIVYAEPLSESQNHISIPNQLNQGIYVVSMVTADGVISRQIKL